jgi:hypothetical protein
MVQYKDVMKEYNLGPNEETLTFEQDEDATIRTKTVFLHHIPILHRVADINVGPEWQCHHRMVKVNDRYMLLKQSCESLLHPIWHGMMSVRLKPKIVKIIVVALKIYSVFYIYLISVVRLVLVLKIL